MFLFLVARLQLLLKRGGARVVLCGSRINARTRVWAGQSRCALVWSESAAQMSQLSPAPISNHPHSRDAGHEVMISDYDSATSDQHFQFVYFEQRNSISS